MSLSIGLSSFLDFRRLCPSVFLLACLLSSFVSNLALFRDFEQQEDDPSVGYIWQISDVHLDLEYKTGAEPLPPLCPSEPCCRDFFANQTAKAGKFGYPLSTCDVPVRTFDGALDFMFSFPFSADAIIYTGDWMAHDGYVETKEEVVQYCDAGLKAFRDGIARAKHKPKLALLSIGNHDAFPEDQLCLPSVSPDCSEFIIGPMSDFMEPYLDPLTTKFVRQHGYYSVDIDKSLRLVMLNSMIPNAANLYSQTYEKESTHPMNEFLRGELEKARDDGKKVVVAGHIPPAGEWYRIWPSWNSDFVEIVREFADTVEWSMWGHEHKDRVFLQRHVNGSVASVGFSSPAVVTFMNGYPAVRLFLYNRTTGTLLDIVTYVNDIEESNLSGSMAENWVREYSMKELYLMPDLSRKSFGSIVDRIVTDRDYWDLFLRLYYANLRHSFDCEGSCEKEQKCLMQFTLFQDFLACRDG